MHLVLENRAKGNLVPAKSRVALVLRCHWIANWQTSLRSELFAVRSPSDSIRGPQSQRKFEMALGKFRAARPLVVNADLRPGAILGVFHSIQNNVQYEYNV